MQFASVTIFFSREDTLIFLNIFSKIVFACAPEDKQTNAKLGQQRKANQSSLSIESWKHIEKNIILKILQKRQKKKSSPVNLVEMISMHNGKLYIECSPAPVTHQRRSHRRGKMAQAHSTRLRKKYSHSSSRPRVEVVPCAEIYCCIIFKLFWQPCSYFNVNSQ